LLGEKVTDCIRQKGPANTRPALSLHMLAATLLILLRAAPAQTYSVIYNFTGLDDGGNSRAGLILDQWGSLYATGTSGGTVTGCSSGGACGVVFKLSPPAQNGDPWTESVLYDFQDQDPFPPTSNLVFAPHGNLYGSTAGTDHALYQLVN